MNFHFRRTMGRDTRPDRGGRNGPSPQFRRFDSVSSGYGFLPTLYPKSFSKSYPNPIHKSPKPLRWSTVATIARFAMTIKVERVVFLSLLLDLFAFTIPLPLFPRIIEWYTIVSPGVSWKKTEHSTTHSVNPHTLTVSSQERSASSLTHGTFS